jgi:mannose-1-phosphate guanylyltransferase/mannose-6-phosphate isomerase
MSKLIPVVLSGGTGTRLWPVSREGHPKQFLPLVTESSMLQDTVARTQGLDTVAPYIVGNDEHRFMLAEQMRAMGVSPGAIILEPVGRNTAPAVALAAFRAVAEFGSDALMLVLPADHAIVDSGAFCRAVSEACEVAAQGYLMTFGIKPTKPETGYGYIKTGVSLQGNALAIDAFVEKPRSSACSGLLGKRRLRLEQRHVFVACWALFG